MKQRLIVTVDTEEEGLWGGQYRPTGNTVENIQGIPRFQDLCDRFGVRPTYLVTAPVVMDRNASGILAAIHDDGRCEIGTHLHPWCTPPLSGQKVPAESFLCNLPVNAQRAKVRWLTDAIRSRFGRRPTSFRAGRYGLDIQGARILEDFGYLVDSSVIPFTDYSSQGGPDFLQAPFVPYRVGGSDLCVARPEGSLLEVPVSVGFNRVDFAMASTLQHWAASRWLRRFHVEGLMDRLGIVRRIKFSPEQADISQLRTLVATTMAATHHRATMVLMLHSSSLMVGGSPYVRSERELDGLCSRIHGILQHCVQNLGFEPLTLSECAGEHAYAL